jgi:hypothetical protein
MNVCTNGLTELMQPAKEKCAAQNVNVLVLSKMTARFIGPLLRQASRERRSPANEKAQAQEA